nr:MFS transporter [Streptococcus gallolyticus]
MMKKVHKAWKVLMVLCGLAAASVGISINTSGVFYSVVADDLALLRGAFAFHMTIFSLVTAVSALLVPRFLRKIPFKVLLTISVVVAVMSTAFMAVSTQLWQFYLLGAIRGFSTGMFSIVTITTVINHWFIDKNGLATSIALTFSGIMGAIFSPVFSAIIAVASWQTAYLIEALLLFCLCLPAILYPFAIQPEASNARAYGAKRLSSPTSANLGDKRVLTLALILIMSFGVMVSFVSSMTQHLPSYAKTLASSATVGASLLSMGMFGNIISKLIMGFLSDKIGAIKSSLLLLLANSLGTILLLVTRSPVLLLLAALLFGACYGLGAVSLPLLTQLMFGKSGYTKTFPLVSFVSNIGAATAFSIIGYSYDFTRSYTPALIFIVALLFLSMLSLIVIHYLMIRPK